MRLHCCGFTILASGLEKDMTRDRNSLSPQQGFSRKGSSPLNSARHSMVGGLCLKMLEACWANGAGNNPLSHCKQIPHLRSQTARLDHPPLFPALLPPAKSARCGCLERWQHVTNCCGLQWAAFQHHGTSFTGQSWIVATTSPVLYLE